MKVTAQVAAGSVFGLGLLTIGLAALNRDAASVLGAVFFLAYPVVASVVARNQPRHALVWCFLAGGLLIGIEKSGQEVVALGLPRNWKPLLTHVAAWAEAWAWFPGLFVLITVGLLRFPDGRLLSPRWRWVERASIAAMAVWVLGVGIATWGVSTADLASNQPPDPHDWRGVVFKGAELMFLAIVPCVLAALASLVVRHRRSGPAAREQTRWVLYAASVAIGIEIVLDLVGASGTHLPDWTQSISEGVGFALIAVAVGVAITRYRLYEIDHIVSRTVSWSLISALLVGTYLGIAAAAGEVIPTRFGSLGVAGATLAAAALFVPVRLRVQRVVDRRFDRSRYDGSRIVDAFAVRMREELGESRLDAELLATVRAALAPATAFVWTREDPGSAVFPRITDPPGSDPATSA